MNEEQNPAHGRDCVKTQTAMSGGQYHLAVLLGLNVGDCQGSIVDWNDRDEPIGNRNSTIGSVETHPLPEVVLTS